MIWSTVVCRPMLPAGSDANSWSSVSVGLIAPAVSAWPSV
jgi:hypothetical protein